MSVPDVQFPKVIVDGLVLLNRLSLGCVTSQRKQSGDFTRRLNVIRLLSNNAATSRILVNPAIL